MRQLSHLQPSSVAHVGLVSRVWILEDDAFLSVVDGFVQQSYDSILGIDQSPNWIIHDARLDSHC